MNIVDIVIVLGLVGALIRGQELGFVRQLFSTVGFFIGLLLGALLEPHVVQLAHSSTSRLILTLLTTLGCAFFLLFTGEIIGIIIKQRLQLKHGLNHVDNSLGAGLAGISILAVVWLGAAVLVALPYVGLQSGIRSSRIISLLDRNLPPAPNLIADIGHLIAPNGFPDVFIGLEPAPGTAPLPTPASLVPAVNKDRASVVQIEGDGCGGVVEGSGFVVSSNLVATNAHVVAGIAHPYVIDGNGTHLATAIWFDPNLDFAVLRVNNLRGGPLVLDTNVIPHGTAGGVLGYPGGGPFSASTAAVLDEFTPRGRNIYNQGSTQRDVYSIEANVVPGNSGGPLVNTNGDVIGVVFAASTMYNDVGYALSMPQIVNEIDHAKAVDRPTSTGSCTQE